MHREYLHDTPRNLIVIVVQLVRAYLLTFLTRRLRLDFKLIDIIVQRVDVQWP